MKNRNLDHKDDWATPPEFYEKLNKEFGFDFDPCPWQHDINKWDGLAVEWGSRNYVNPPYSLRLKTAFTSKVIEQQAQGKLSAVLLPVSTSTKLFHKSILPFTTRPIRFIEGRLPFIGTNSKGQKVNYHLIQETTNETISYDGMSLIPLYVKNSGMHDSMIVIFDGAPTYVTPKCLICGSELVRLSSPIPECPNCKV